MSFSLQASSRERICSWRARMYLVTSQYFDSAVTRTSPSGETAIVGVFICSLVAWKGSGRLGNARFVAGSSRVVELVDAQLQSQAATLA